MDHRSLVAHPDTPATAVQGVSYSIVWQDAGHWRIDFMVQAKAEALRLPAPAEPGRAEALWKHTCFEVFLRDVEGEAYVELNFAPSGQWAAYRFDGYRVGGRDLDIAPPQIFTTDPAQFVSWAQRQFPQLNLDAESLREGLDEIGPAGQYALSAGIEDLGLASGAGSAIGVSAVIEEADGTTSYWAIAHPPGRPDFHHADCFAAELTPVEIE